MLKCRVPAVIIAVAIGLAGLAACGSSASSSAAAVRSTASAPATPASSAPPASPTASPARTHSAAAAISSAAPDPATSAAPEPATSAATHAAAIPVKAPSSSTGSGTHYFTVPGITGDNIVTGHGSYTRVGTESVKVSICAQQTGAAFSVGTEALAYNSSGGSQNLGAVILTGPGAPTCVSGTIPFYTAHLKVHAFIGGDKGTITKTGPVLTLY
jgi:hypothetical protein